MAGTKTKKAAAKPQTTAKPEPAVALVAMPADWQGPPSWHGASLGYCLVRAEVLDDEKLLAALNIKEQLKDLEPLANEWLAKRLVEAERAQIEAFVRVISWLDQRPENGATPTQLTLPDCLLPIVMADMNTTEKVRQYFEAKLIGEPEASITDVEQAAAEQIASAAASEVSPMPTVEPDGQIALVTEPVKPATIKPMAFRSGAEVAAVRRALEAELKELEKMAKDSDAMGEPAAAKIFRDKALLLKTQLIPQVTAQGSLPFNEKESLASLVGRTVAGEVRARVRAGLLKNVAPKKGESMKDAQQRKLGLLDDMESLIGNIAEQMGALATKFVSAAADRGIAVGKQAIQADGATVAREAIQLVEFELQAGRAA